MDSRTFDQWTTAIARRPNRRSALGLLAGALLTGLSAGRGVAPAHALRRPDRDQDGLFDDDETDVYGTNPDVYDTDGDGVGDGEEVYLGTDPLVNANAAPPPAGCSNGLFDCGGVCVDLWSDLANCGACGTSCESPYTCFGGFCAEVFPIILE